MHLYLVLSLIFWRSIWSNKWWLNLVCWKRTSDMHISYFSIRQYTHSETHDCTTVSLLIFPSGKLSNMSNQSTHDHHFRIVPKPLLFDLFLISHLFLIISPSLSKAWLRLLWSNHNNFYIFTWNTTNREIFFIWHKIARKLWELQQLGNPLKIQRISSISI